MNTFKVCGLMVVGAGLFLGGLAGYSCVVAPAFADLGPVELPEKARAPLPALMYIDYRSYSLPEGEIVKDESRCWEFILYENGRIDYGVSCAEGGLCSAMIDADAIEAIRAAMASTWAAVGCGGGYGVPCGWGVSVATAWPECMSDEAWAMRRRGRCDEAYFTLEGAVKAVIADARDVRPLAGDDPQRQAVIRWVRGED